MTALIAVFTSSFVIALSGAMMPGTLLTVTVAESSRRGMIAGPMLIVGHAILEVALICAILFGLAPLFEKQWFFIGISFIGGIILLWLAFGMFRSLPSLRVKLDAHNARGGNLVITGILMSVANPYWIIWWATIGVTYIMNSKLLGPTGIIVFFMGHILADLAWYTLISAAVGKGRSFFSDRIYRGLIAVCASALIFFAGLFIMKAVKRVVL
jgi:threonine/homoserine/homoserine lactone efflux protein